MEPLGFGLTDLRNETVNKSCLLGIGHVGFMVYGLKQQLEGKTSNIRQVVSFE